MSDILEPWGTIELEAEVEAWIRSLSPSDFGQVQFYVDLLEREGVLLDEPYTRQLFGKLRELRFYLGASRVRISYFIASGRRIVLLTVFEKHSQRERREVQRAVRAMERCIQEGHRLDDEVV